MCWETGGLQCRSSPYSAAELEQSQQVPIWFQCDLKSLQNIVTEENLYMVENAPLKCVFLGSV